MTDSSPRAWAFALSLLGGLLALYLAGFLSVHTVRGVRAWQMVIFPVFSWGVAFWFFRKSTGAAKQATLCLMAQAGLIGLTLAVSAPFHDFSWDGMTTRSLLVREMSTEIPPKRVPTPAFGHVLSAYALQLTGSWNAGKFINLLVPVLTCLMAGAALRRMQVRGAWGWGFLAALNPVALCQLSSFQVDGLVAGFFTAQLFSLACLLHAGKMFSEGAAAAALSTLGLALAKTSGIFYGGLVLVIFLGFFLVRTKNFRAVLGAAGLAAVFALVFGWLLRDALNFPVLRPGYLWEAISSQGLGYGYTPGGGATQIEDFTRSSKLRQFLASNFSYTEIAPTGINWKPPFWLIRREIRVFEELTPDPRAGGFGPLYGTALLVGWSAFAIALFQGSVRPAWHQWFLTLSVIASSFPSQVWWARWVPQLWLLALIPLLMVAGSKQPHRKPVRVLGGVAVAVLVVNLGLIILYYGLGMVRAQRVLDSQLALLQKLPQPVSLFVPRFTANRFWLEDAGIEAELIGVKPGVPRMKIVKTTSWVGLPPGWRNDASDSRLLAELEKRQLLQEEESGPDAEARDLPKILGD